MFSKNLRLDPQDFASRVFKSPTTVKNFTSMIGEDAAATNKLAVDYAMRQLSAKKTPQAMKDWLTSNREWLNEKTLPDAYAKVAKTVNDYAGAKSAVSGLDAAAKSMADFREPIAKIIRNSKNSPDDIPTKLRAYVNNLPTNAIPEDLRQALSDRISVYEKAVKKDAADKALAKKMGIGAAGVGTGYELYRSIFGGKP
jgi:hypothetical protein